MSKKIVKLQWGNSFNTWNTSYNPQAAFGATYFKSNPLLFNLSNGFTLGSTLGVPNVSNFGKYIMNNPKVAGNSTSPSMGQQALSGAVSQIGGALANNIGNTLFDLDTHFGSIMGGLFSSASSSALGNLSSNILKGNALTQGMGKDVLGSVGNAAAGIAANYAGRGITKAMGNSNLGKFTGAAAANVGATLGGAAISRALGMAGGAVNPLALGMTAVGAGLGAMNGPSKEYGGKYGDITKTMDTIYDLASVGVNLLPGGLIISGAMVLNKGLSNTFGSTSGMTKQDAILGSAFMPAPVKWANVLGGKTTSTFNKQSWQNSEKTSNFMQNAFGDLLDRFDRARREAGKTYGTFSRKAYRRALANINFANQAWDKVLSMADLNIYQNIRAQDMASINNQKYMQDIQGGFSPLARGKQGMKILSNRINHNTGMRLLSGAALIDNKQMILSALIGIKFPKLQLTELVAKSDNTRVLKPVVMGPVKRKLKPGQLLFNNHGKLVVVEPKRTYIQQDNRDSKIREESHRRSVLVREQELMRKAEKQTALVAGAILDRTMPSHWIQKATGQDLGTVGRLFTDLSVPFILGKGFLALRKAGLLAKVPRQDVTENIFSPDYLANTFINSHKGKSKYIEDIADDMYGLNPNLQNVDYKSMNKYGNIFNKRIKRTLPLAKSRGTLRTDKEPNIFVADYEGRRRLYDTFINDTPTLKWDRTVHIGDPVTDKGKLAKDYYHKTKPAEDVFDTKPSSFADRKNNTIVVIPNRGYENMYKYTVPHEKTHIFIDGRKEKALFGNDTGLGTPYHKPGDTGINLDLYLARPDEQLARGTQIKNYLGITDESPITAEQLKYAAENYVKDTGYDNNMTEFFSMIKDYKKAAKWLSMAPVALPFIGGSTATTLYNKSK